jgi:hypothetical protein
MHTGKLNKTTNTSSKQQLLVPYNQNFTRALPKGLSKQHALHRQLNGSTMDATAAEERQNMCK